MEFRLATIQDCEEVSKLNKVVDKGIDYKITGFIITQKTTKEYEDIVKENNLYIAVYNKIIVGYMWVSNKKEYEKESPYGKVVDKDYYFIMQIVSKPNTGLSVGKFLYDNLIKIKRVPLYASVWTKPLNQRSLDFHIKYGWDLITEFNVNEVKKMKLFKFDNHFI